MKNSFKKNFLFFAVFLALILVLFEITLRILEKASDELKSLTTSYKNQEGLLSDPLFIYRGNPKFPDHDSRGFRNKTALNKADIVVFGDSQSYGSGVHRENNWPNRLESISGKTVYSMALSGWGPVQSLFAFDEAEKLRPNTIIEAVYLGNDLFDSFRMVYNNKNDTEILKNKDRAFLEQIAVQEQLMPLEKMINNEFTEIFGGLEPKYSFLKTYNLLYALNNLFKDVHRRQDAISGGKIESFNNGKIQTLFTPSYRGLATGYGDLRIKEGWRIILEVLKQMSEKSKEKNIEFAVLILPTKEYAFVETAEGQKFSREYYQSAMNEKFLIESLELFLKNYGIEYIDATQAFRENINKGISPYFKNADGHPSEIGHKIIAQLINQKINK